MTRRKPKPRTMLADADVTPCLPRSVRSILAEVAHQHDLPVSELLGTSDKHRLAKARGEAMARLLRHVMPGGRPYSTRQIAAWFGCHHENVRRKAQVWGEAA